MRETDPKKRRALIDRVQTIFHEDVGRVKFGDYFLLDVVRKDSAASAHARALLLERLARSLGSRGTKHPLPPTPPRSHEGNGYIGCTRGR